MLIDNPLTGYSLVVAFLLLAEWVFLALFLWELSVGMDMLETLVTSISLSFGIWMQFHVGFFEQTEVVSSAIAEIGADDLKRSRLGILGLGQLGYDELGFERMALLFARVIAFLSFFGRSIGDSEASTRITSYWASLPSRALRPGRAKRLSLMRVSSTH
jgi:hypothetical protein